VLPEFALDARAKVMSTTGPIFKQRDDRGLRLRVNGEGSAEIQLANGVNLVLLPEASAEEVWRVDDASLLLSTRADVYSDGSKWTLESEGRPEIDFGIFGTDAKPAAGAIPVRKTNADGIFQNYKSILPEVKLQPIVTKVCGPGPRAPWSVGAAFPWRSTPIAMAPDDADFEGAATWMIEIPPVPRGTAISDAFLMIAYQGDGARLSLGHHLVDDDFWNGIPWSIGLREVAPDWRNANTEMNLRILPLPRKFPMYLEQAAKLQFGTSGVADSLTDVQLVLKYQLIYFSRILL
jgi:hypothetical protein